MLEEGFEYPPQERSGEIVKVKVVEGIKTKGEGAKAASRLYQELVKEGVPPEEARELATHELAHQRGDKGKGTIGYLKEKKTGEVMGAYYEPEDRSPENMLRIVTAPGRGETAEITELRMGEIDVKLLKRALKEKRLGSRK